MSAITYDSVCCPDRSLEEVQVEALIAQFDEAAQELQEVRNAIKGVIFGQDQVIEGSLTAVLAGGHALLVGVPGLAKTRLVACLAAVLGLDNKRIQFTPDLMPSDIIGTEILDSDHSGKRSLRYVKGPIFTQLLMADEINRASPRTQSALLQAMQEYHITVAGESYHLPMPFHVLATQNPLEQEGTYSLPEAQLDRFLMQINIDYPDLESERQIITTISAKQETLATAILSPARLQSIQKMVRQMPISEEIIEAILRLVRALRPGANNEHAQQHIAWGPGPRASQAFSLCARARALYHGRLAPSLDDICALAVPILQHRMALNFNARTDNLDTRTILLSTMKKTL
ncbi:AAA family ATPase [Bartonella sp. DGB2]|uniref:AAA family ATPase n=1 Tax=Bartonella sp. DGB2 TaxID=3388426 RepID=UPI00398F91AA